MTAAEHAPHQDGPLHVSAVITGKPGTGDTLEPLLLTLAAATQREDGCLLYSLQRGTTDRDVFVTVEKWTGAPALDQHLGSEHVQAALTRAGELLALAPQIIPTAPVATGNGGREDY